MPTSVGDDTATQRPNSPRPPKHAQIRITNAPSGEPIPAPGWRSFADRHDVTPWIIGSDSAGVIDWLIRVFDAEEIDRMVGDDGFIAHAEVRIGDSVVMLLDKPDWPATPAFLRIYCPDIHQAHDRAVAAGGTSLTRPTHLFWGDLAARVTDPFHNVYWLNQQIEQPDEAEMHRRMSDPEFTNAMAYVTSAQVPLP